MAIGVLAGAKAPIQVSLLMPGTPNSANVGMSGAKAVLASLATAKARTRPSLMNGKAELTADQDEMVCPATTAWID